MKKLFCCIMVALFLGSPAVMAAAKGKKAAAKKAAPAARKATPQAAAVVPEAGPQARATGGLGREVVYVSTCLSSASFQKDALHPLKHDLFYGCPPCNYFRRTPGTCPKKGCSTCQSGQQCALIPCFRHGKTWHTITRDSQGNLLVDVGGGACCGGAPAMKTDAGCGGAPAN